MVSFSKVLGLGFKHVEFGQYGSTYNKALSDIKKYF